MMDDKELRNSINISSDIKFCIEIECTMLGRATELEEENRKIDKDYGYT